MEIILCDERTKSTVCDLGREFLFYVLATIDKNGKRVAVRRAQIIRQPSGVPKPPTSLTEQSHPDQG